MSKRVFIVHGWDFNPEMNWYPWLAAELKKRGFSVYVLEMPNTSEPEINAWVSHLEKAVGKLDEQTFFIGHSIGCQTIMRFLESQKEKCAGALFVAGWFALDNLESEEVAEIAKPWLTKPINYERVINNLGKLAVLLSSNDPYNKLKENKNIFEEKLKAKVKIIENKGHFTQDDGCKELPEALQEFLKIAEE